MAKFKLGDVVNIIRPSSIVGTYDIPDECWGPENEYEIMHVEHLMCGYSYLLRHKVKNSWGWNACEEMLEACGGPW